LAGIDWVTFGGSEGILETFHNSSVLRQQKMTDQQLGFAPPSLGFFKYTECEYEIKGFFCL
jgi:hypothetical protein